MESKKGGRQTDSENKLMVTGGQDRGERTVREFRVDMDTHYIHG